MTASFFMMDSLLILFIGRAERGQLKRYAAHHAAFKNARKIAHETAGAVRRPSRKCQLFV
jgi:hypothetical protein